MSNQAVPCRIHRRGNSLYLLLADGVRKVLPWRPGDFIAARVCGEKLILERLTLEKAATIRTGETEPYAANLREP